MLKSWIRWGFDFRGVEVVAGLEEAIHALIFKACIAVLGLD